MSYWLHLHNTQPEQMVALARLAEEVGFEGVLGDDHWFMPAGSADHDPNERAPLRWDYVFPDLFVTGATILASTTRLKFGSCIMVLANRTNPFLVAKAAATLSRVSGDRFILGVGAGWMQDEYDMAGIDFKTRVPRTVEMIGILRKLWGEGPVSHEGRFFNFPPTYAEPRPIRPVPIYIGSVAPPALIRTGGIGDGWMGMTATLEELPGQIALINQGRQEAGREDAPFEFMIGLRPHADGTLPTLDDYRRSADLGITQHHFGPIEHMIGKIYPSYDEKRRVIEDFAERIIARA
ncbi:MAG: putative F420-dependent oxidoreductase, Rv2161c family protein [Sphingomonadales bacterium]|nr:putative F420-dependent oxidoreductase, Rv2161c family protein [Sphingomonadales bacterium]